MRRASVVLVGLLPLVACSAPPAGTPVPSAESSPPPAALRYVALGDSYTAAPLVPSIDGGSGLCVRSTANYPALVAEALEAEGRSVRLADRSCVEARTADLFAPQVFDSSGPAGLDGLERRGTVPPQTVPLNRRTDLVTVGIGGNDVLTSLVGTCPSLRDEDPTGAPCAALLGDEPVARLADLRVELTDALSRVADAAPRAEVLVVGYPQTVPPSGTCPERLPLADGDVAYARGVADELEATLQDAAADARVGFVDVYAASAGHDICAADPWVNGARTDPGAALAFHPFAAGQQAVADLVVAGVAD